MDDGEGWGSMRAGKRVMLRVGVLRRRDPVDSLLPLVGFKNGRPLAPQITFSGCLATLSPTWQHFRVQTGSTSMLIGKPTKS